MLCLVVHADAPPEFKDEILGARIQFAPIGSSDSIIYESLGRASVWISEDPEEDPQVYADCRLFAHPDLFERIRRDGAVKTVSLSPGRGA